MNLRHCLIALLTLSIHFPTFSANAGDEFGPSDATTQCSGSKEMTSAEICIGKSMCYCGGEGFSFHQQGLTEKECKAACKKQNRDYLFTQANDVNKSTIEAKCKGLSNVVGSDIGTPPACNSPCYWRRTSEGPKVEGDCCTYRTTASCVGSAAQS